MCRHGIVVLPLLHEFNIVDHVHRRVCVCTVTNRGGDLHRALKSRGATFDRAKRFRLASQIAEGMAFLHARDCLHLDLKALNVLVRNGST